MSHVRTFWAARLALINSVGFSATTILPLWIAALPSALAVPPWQVGAVGTLQLMTCGLANLAGPVLISRRPPLVVASRALWVTAVGCVGEGLSLVVGGGSLALFCVSAMLVGAALGVLLAMTNKIMANSDHAQQGYAIFQIIEVLFASMLFLVGAALLHDGGAYLFLLVAMLCLVGQIALRGLSGTETAPVAPRDLVVDRSKAGRGFLLLGALLCFFAGQSSVNSFLIPIGKQSGLADAMVVYVIWGGMVFGLVGATAARVLGERFGTFRPIAFVGAIVALDFIIISATRSPAIFTLGATVIPTSTIFVVPYFFTALAGLGSGGRFAAFGPAFLIAGASLGPVLAGSLIEFGGFALVGWSAALLIALAIALAASASRSSPHLQEA